MFKRVKYASMLMIFVQLGLYAQINLSTISISVGTTRNSSNFNKTVKDYSLYPKLDVRGRFFSEMLTWKLFLGYWNDGVKTPYYTDAEVYSYTSYNVGFALQIQPKNILRNSDFALKFNLGLSSHFYVGKYVGGENPVVSDKGDQNETVPYADIGLELSFKLNKYLTPYIEGEYHVQLNSEMMFFQPWSASVGLSYNFK